MSNSRAIEEPLIKWYMFYMFPFYIMKGSAFVVWQNLKVGHKIIGLVLVMVVCSALTGGIGYYYSAMLAKDLDVMFSERLMIAQGVNATRNNLRAIEADLWHLMLVSDKAEEQRLLNNIQLRRAENNKFLDFYNSLPLDNVEREKLKVFRETLLVFRAECNKAFELVSADKKQEAYIQSSENVAKPLEQLITIFEELVVYNEEKSRELDISGHHHAQMAKRIMIIVTVASVIIGLAMGYWLARMIARRLEHVGEVVTEVANGNFCVPTLHIAANDEIGAMGTAMNTMITNLRTLIKQVSESAEQVAASSQQLSASADQSAQAIGQVAATIGDVSEGTTKQVNAVDVVTNVVHNVATSTQQISANINSMAEVAQSTERATNKGQLAIEEVIKQMGNVGNSTEKVAKAVHDLALSSNQIAEIVDVISGIASQTNLLALNAAIEAARAGEQGRGFAVVAEEVRKLAEQSQESAKQIADLIRDNHAHIEQTVELMNNGTSDVRIGVEVADNAGKTFGDIAVLISTIAGQVKDMSAAVQEIAQGSQKIESAIDSVEQISKATAQQSQTVTAATEEQTASMEEISASSQELAKMAQELQHAVHKFRI